MTLKQQMTQLMARRLAGRGLEVRRHAAARRQGVLGRAGVDLVLDVGAADGGFGRELRRFGYRGPIVSFEPLREVHADLVRRTGDDPAWDARHLALGREPGEATINVASNSRSSSILPMLGAHLEAAPSVTYVGQQQITISTLDDEVSTDVAAARAPFLKIDTQGFERDVLAGGATTLERCAVLQLEMSFVPLYAGDMLVDEAIAWAYDHGFVLVVVDQGYASPTGEMLQVDGVFVRREIDR